MRKNMLKEKIRNGESAIGTFVKLTDPAVPELLALAGFDFFVLDTEHVAVDREQLTNIVRAADAARHHAHCAGSGEPAGGDPAESGPGICGRARCPMWIPRSRPGTWCPM